MAIFLMRLASILPDAIDKAVKHAERELSRKTPNFSAENLVPTIAEALAQWSPEVKGRKVVTPKLARRASVTFAHLAWNIALAQQGRDPE